MTGKMWVILLLLLLVCFGFGKAGKNGSLYLFPQMPLFPAMPLPEHPITNSGVALGRFLFYDTLLSRDSSISCGSCHKQEYAFSDGGIRFSKGIDGKLQKRNTLPLFNLNWHTSFFWDGRAECVESQVFHPITDSSEMALTVSELVSRLRRSVFYRRKFREAFGGKEIDSELIGNAIGQFERTILSYRSKFDRAIKGSTMLSKQELEGFVLMNDMTKGDCLHCHTTDSDPIGSTFEFSNNGLDTFKYYEDYKDAGRGGVTGVMEERGMFKIPSVRNLAFTAPYMHDGRFRTLEEVLSFYSSGVSLCVGIDSKMGFAHTGGNHLSEKEQESIIAFLMAISDSSLVADAQFANPFR